MFESWARRLTKPRRRSLAFGLLAAGLFVLLWAQVARFHRTGVIALQRAQTADRLGDRVLALRLTIEKRLAAAESLAAFLRVTPAADLPADLPPFLRQIYERTPRLKAVWAAPDGVITYIYPEKGNQAIVGLDLGHDAWPEERGAVDRTLRTGQVIITPPHPLIQGGTDITARLAAEGPDGGRWIAGVCVDFPGLLEEAGFDAKGSPLLIAVRGPDGKVVYGPSSLFSDRPVLKSLELGGGRWEFGAAPAAGWGADTEASSAFHWAIGGIIALLLFCFTYLLVNRRERLRDGIREKTSTITRLNEELRAELWARQESETRFASFMRYLPALAFLRDAEGRYVYVNEAWERLTGKTAQEALGRPVDELLPPAEAQAILEEDARILGGEELLWDQERLVVNDRETWWIASKFPVRDAEGRTTLVGGISIEITDRKRAEKALAESEERYRALFEHNLAGVYLTTLEGRLLECNHAFAAMFGFGSSAEAMEARDHHFSADPSQYGGFLQRLLREGALTRHEVMARRKDGSLFQAIENVALIRGPQGEQLIEGTLMDLSEHEALARERLRARGLEIIGTIAAGVAHEVRNPLFAIQVNLEALARRFSPSAETRSFLDNVLEHAGRLNSLMQSLLELGQVSSHEAILVNDPRQIVAEALALAEQNNPRLRGRVATAFCDRPQPFAADPQKIVKALLHLLDNAAQVSPPEGTVTLACVCKDGLCAISISDQGPGLPPSIRDRLFEPFVTASSNRRGLGLALARHYVESSGGTLEAADNAPPPGATFTVKLPIVEGTAGSEGSG
ncbi:MAG: PAS domain S-box protein [Acidobacteriota bacterium]